MCVCAGASGRGMEVRSLQAVDELLRGRGHCTTPAQRHAHPQELLLPAKVDAQEGLLELQDGQKRAPQDNTGEVC